jgi:aconitate hydratase
MLDLSSTPQMVAKVYETMRSNLAGGPRRNLDRPLTLADKVLLGHLDDPASQEMIPGKVTSRCGPTG